MPHNTTPWKKEHYDLLYSSKNCDDCCKDFQKRFPSMTLSSIFSHWNHKNQYRQEYERLKNESSKPKPQEQQTSGNDYLSQKEKIKKLREILLSLNLKDGENIPWGKLLKSAGDYFQTEGTIRAVICGYGNYKKANSTKYFKDIVSTASTGAKIFRKPIALQNQSPIMVPAKIVHKYDLEKKPTTFVDEDRMLVKDHDLRAEQVQLLKEMVTLLTKIKDATEKNTNAVTKWAQSIEDARNLVEKKRSEQIVQQVTA
jgi:hypothetical protein